MTAIIRAFDPIRSDPIRSDHEAWAFVVAWVRLWSRIYGAPPEYVDPLKRTTIKTTSGLW
jgi:hypothetical protein